MINAKANGRDRHHRVDHERAAATLSHRGSRRPADRKSVLLAVRIAEVRKDASYDARREPPVSIRDGNVRVGTGIFDTDNVVRQGHGRRHPDPATTQVRDAPHRLRHEELPRRSSRRSRRTATRDCSPSQTCWRATATPQPSWPAARFPVPIAQPSANGGVVTITIQFREFGIRLNFIPEIVSDSLIKLTRADLRCRASTSRTR